MTTVDPAIRLFPALDVAPNLARGRRGRVEDAAFEEFAAPLRGRKRMPDALSPAFLDDAPSRRSGGTARDAGRGRTPGAPGRARPDEAQARSPAHRGEGTLVSGDAPARRPFAAAHSSRFIAQLIAQEFSGFAEEPLRNNALAAYRAALDRTQFGPADDRFLRLEA